MASSIADMVQALSSDPTIRDNPYPLYSALRGHADVVVLSDEFSVATSFRAVTDVLRGSDMGKSISDERFQSQFSSSFDRRYPPSMLFQDPPTHTRLRRSVARRFTPHAIRDFEASIDRRAAELLGELHEQGGDLIASLALPLPVWAVGELLGVPVGDREVLRPLVSAVAKSLDFTFEVSEDEAARVAAAASELLRYFEEFVATDPRQLPEGILRDLVEDDEQVDLTTEEICVMALLLFAAGFETTTNLIGNATMALSQNPGEFQKLTDGRCAISSAIDELIRFDSPVQVDGRVVQRDLELYGQHLRRGSFVVTLIGSANHDEAVFSSPSSLRLDRSEGPALSFGGGIHYCLGAYLAKAELKAYLSNLMAFGLPEITESIRKQTLTLRGFDSLELKWES